MSERNAKLTRRYLATFQTKEHRLTAERLVRAGWRAARTADQRGQLAATLRRHLAKQATR
jgi:hypothetical protein